MTVTTGSVADDWRIRWDKNHPPNDSTAVSYTDITSQVVGEVRCFRGRRHELEPCEVGYIEFTLNVPDFEYDPMNPNGEIGSGWEPTNTQVNLQVLVGVTWYDLFTGWVEDVPSPETDNYSRVQVRAADGIKYLSEQKMPEDMWSYEVLQGSWDHWYRFDEEHGDELRDRIGTADGQYQRKDSSGAWQDSGQAKQFRGGPLIRFGLDDVSYNMGEHAREDRQRAPRVIIPAAATPTGTTWTISLWVRSKEFPDEWTDTGLTNPIVSGTQQPIWVIDENVGNVWEGAYIGLYIGGAGANKGDFIAVRRTGGTRYTTVFATGTQGHNGEPHMVTVQRSGSSIYLKVDGNTRTSVGTVSITADASNRITVGGILNDTVTPQGLGLSAPFPWFNGQVSDIIIDKTTLWAEADLQDLYQAGENGLLGKGIDNPTVDEVVDKILEIADYQIGTASTPTGSFEAGVEAPGQDRSCLEYLRHAERTEMGRMHFAGDGGFVMLRESDLGAAVKVTFSNNGTTSSYMWLGLDAGYSVIGSVFNDVTVGTWTDREVTNKNSTSISNYGRHTLQWETMLRTAAAGRTRASLLTGRYSDPVVRINELTWRPDESANAAKDAAAMLLGDTVRIIRQMPAGAASAGTYDEQHIVEGIEHRISRGDWVQTLYLSPNFY